MTRPLFNPSIRLAGLWGKTMLAGGLLLAGWSASAGEYGTVVSSTPVYTQVAVPQQQCYDEPQAVAPRNSGAGALAGAVIGGLIGNQFGRGGGRVATTGAGMIAGAVIGNNIEGQPSGSVAMVRRCQTVTGYESRVTAYDVVYDYQGRRFSSRMAQDPGTPGSAIALDVSVNPAGATPEPYPPVAPPQVGAPPAVQYGNTGEATAYPAEPVTTVYYTEPVRPVVVAPPPVYYAPPPPVYYGRPVYRGGTTIYFSGDRRDDRWDRRGDDRRGDNPRWEDRRGNPPPPPEDRRRTPPPTVEDIRRQRH